MSRELLEIQPMELKFTLELKKQSSCPVQLYNKSNHHVAFKVKTTNPKKYCVRPNMGIINPKSKCDFMVTMQAPRSIPSEILCKDKFLVQSTVVPVGITEEDITPITFTKDDGKYIEETKLKVTLTSPLNSPVLSPISGTKHQVPDESSLPNDEVQNRDKKLELHQPHQVPDESSSPNDKVQNRDEKLELHQPIAKDVEESKVEIYKGLEPSIDAEVKAKDVKEEMRIVRDIEEMRLKFNDLELKLNEANVTISNLKDGRRLSAEEREALRQELALLKSKTCNKRAVQVGFPFLFVCMVALIGIVLGYLLHR